MRRSSASGVNADEGAAATHSSSSRVALIGTLLLLGAIPGGGVGTRVTGTAHASVGQAEGPPSGAKFAIKQLPLPGADGVTTLDYFAYDRSRGRLWVPAGNTGSVDVIDGVTDQITRIGGFRTGEFEFRGKRRVLGPSSVSLGDGVVYIGNRGDSSICVIDATTLKLGDCLRIASASEGLAAAPDGIVYVATTKELWVTTGAPPMGVAAADRSIKILDASNPQKLKAKGKLPLDGSAEGYALDEKRGLFYTNLEEERRTVAIDARRRVVVSSWRSGCDEPHGLALDKGRGWLFVACSARVVSLDIGHDGRVAGSIAAGEGVDNIDYLETQRTLYAAAQDAATLTVAHVDDHGGLSRIATVPTVMGTRGVVVDGSGRAWVADPINGRIWKVTLQ